MSKRTDVGKRALRASRSATVLRDWQNPGTRNTSSAAALNFLGGGKPDRLGLPHAAFGSDCRAA